MWESLSREEEEKSIYKNIKTPLFQNRIICSLPNLVYIKHIQIMNKEGKIMYCIIRSLQQLSPNYVKNDLWTNYARI